MTQTKYCGDLDKVQSELERMNRLYGMLSHINRTIVRTDDPQELYTAACRIAVENGGFVLAWIGLLEPGGTGVVPVAAAGVATVEQLKNVQTLIGAQGPTMYATRTEAPFIVNDTLHDPHCKPWQSMIEQWGLRAGGSFPIRLEGNIIGALNVAVTEPDFFRDAEINLLIEVVDDISFALDVIRHEEKRISAETKMRYLAYYDSQTGLPSRTLFEERLTEARHNPLVTSIAVLVINLRRYQGIVQLLGADIGHEVIRTLSAKLELALPTVAVSRLAESKLAVMLSNPEGLHIVEELAWQICRVLSEPILVTHQEMFIDPFVGIASYPKDGEPIDALKHAQQAADTQNTNSHCRFFYADMDEFSRRQLHLDTALRRALERNEFVIYYQPQVDLASGHIIGAEALLRWQHIEYGLVLPSEFIPLLEENGLINQVGEWVLREACRCNRQWQDEGLEPIRIAVNLSARQFSDNDIRKVVGQVLRDTGLDPQWLELELTESIVLLDADNVIHTMNALNADGVSHVLDDFGTGYSSLSYLQRLPVARIKIDRAFVTHITSNPGDAAIVRAVVGMAHNLGISVIAEGVETEGQLGFLRGVGCEEIQGYYFSQPLPEQQFTELLREGRHLPAGQYSKAERILLLLDDEPNILSALTRVLRRQGFRILTTTSTREGFELLATHRPGVVVCDQRMPEMTGTEFLRRVKDLYPDTMRIVLSGYAELNSVIDTVNQGSIYKFLIKPWEDDVLCEVINEAFRIYELRRENYELSCQLQVRQNAVKPRIGS
jgi:EAL domain-containing protein (putative c-di-GMP-specific phosphodiesterase class I)/FixJ family two-component response regulator/GGDEF domain-containing protein